VGKEGGRGRGRGRQGGGGGGQNLQKRKHILPTHLNPPGYFGRHAGGRQRLRGQSSLTWRLAGKKRGEKGGRGGKDSGEARV
jgi:hypothetical protein